MNETRRGFLAKVGLGALALVGAVKATEAKPVGNLTEKYVARPVAPTGLMPVEVKSIDEIRAMYPSATSHFDDDHRLDALRYAMGGSWTTSNATPICYTIDCSAFAPVPWTGTRDGVNWVVIEDGMDTSGFTEFRGVSSVPFPKVSMVAR